MLSPTLVVAICFAGLVCVAPLAFYLCWLASVNRRERPTVVNGAWDFVGVLAGLSGFLLVGGVLLRGILMHDTRVIGGDYTAMQAVNEKQWLSWLAVFAGYLGLIALAVALAVRGRGKSLSVYNVDADAADGAVEAALHSAGVPSTRIGNVWGYLVEVVPFRGVHHVTVRFLGSGRERVEVERHLRTHLAATPSPDNPAAGWFSAVAGGSVFVVVAFVALLSYVVFFVRG